MIKLHSTPATAVRNQGVFFRTQAAQARRFMLLTVAAARELSQRKHADMQGALFYLRSKATHPFGRMQQAVLKQEVYVP